MTGDKGAGSPDTKHLWTEGQICRGRFLDAFARLEAVAMQYAVRLELKVQPSTPFSQKLKKLAAARDRFRHPKRLDDRIEAIGPFNEIRADLVHAELSVVVQHGENDIIKYWLGFQNACHVEKPLRMLSIEELNRMTREVQKLGREFNHQQLKAATPA